MSEQSTELVVRDLDIQALVSQAIEKGTVDVLERVMALAEKWKAVRARDAYFTALAAFQAECPIIVKQKEVYDKHGTLRYRYAPLDKIVEQVREGLKRNGFSYTIDTEQPEGKLVAFCDSHHISGHSERTRLEVPVGSDYMTAQQMVGAARTYAMRYVFCNAYGILTGDEDNDATTTENGAKGAAPEDRPAQSKYLICPRCGKDAIIKGAPQYGGGWVCWKKREGCGAKWTDEEWERALATKEPLPDSAEAQAELLDAQNEELIPRDEKQTAAATSVFEEPPAGPKSRKAQEKAARAFIKGTEPSKDDEKEARELF